MKKLVISATAFVLLASSAAHAQGDERNNRQDDRGQHSDERGPGHWSTGQRLPAEYRKGKYVYSGWQVSGLRQPPRGYTWVLVDDQYALVESRSGLIAEIAILNGGESAQVRDDKWRSRYSRPYSYNDDVAYTGCQNQPDPAGVLAGAFLGGLLGSQAAGRHDRGGATVAGVIAGGAIGAALTSNLECNDRSYAYKAYSQGFNGGRANATYEWENPTNRHHGKLVVLDYYRDEDNFRCAVFTNDIDASGPRHEAHGRACQQRDGTWAIID